MVNTNHYDLDIDTTLGGNSASDYVIPSQKAIKSYVDNNTGTTVDQTFDGTSANAQSGVAINGELTSNYQTKLVSGTNIKTINNTSLLGSGNISVLQNNSDVNATGALSILGNYNLYQGAISIGKDAASSGVFSVSLGEDASAGESSIAIGLNAVANTYSAIQIGEGTNSDSETLSVGFRGKNGAVNPVNYQLLDGSTGLIPDARISSNIARTSAIPTQASDISAADTTLSNVSSIDSNSAVQTALDGKVSKSGDTMTGMLNISKDSISESHFINLVNENITKGTNPVQDTYTTISFNDRTNDSSYLNTRMGCVECSVNANDGAVRMTLAAMKNEVGANIKAQMQVKIDSSGNASCTFPNTNCVDGQWTYSYNDIISSDTSLNGSSDLPKRVPVPNDNYVYEALLIARATTGSTSGNLVRVQISTNVISAGITICSNRTRSASTVECQGAVIVPIKGVASNSTNLDIIRASGVTGNLNILRLVAYRRVGTNS